MDGMRCALVHPASGERNGDTCYREGGEGSAGIVPALMTGRNQSKPPTQKPPLPDVLHDDEKPSLAASVATQ